MTVRVDEPAPETDEGSRSPTRREGTPIKIRAWLVRYVYWPTHVLAAIALVLVMLLTVADVVGRYVFNTPVRGTIELTGQAMLLVAYLGLGYAQHYREHITIDILYQRFPRMLKLINMVIVTLITLLLAAGIAWQLAQHGLRMFSAGMRTGVLGVPVYPAIFIAVVGFVVFSIALVVDLFVTFAVLFGRAREVGIEDEEEHLRAV